MRKRLRTIRKAFIDTNIILRILVADDPEKRKACEKLIREAPDKGVLLHVLPVTILETVWVLEKVYRLDRKRVREIVEAIINTPELLVEMREVLLKALRDYDEKNVKFSDALMAHWGVEKGYRIVYTYDRKHFDRIDGLEVRAP